MSLTPATAEPDVHQMVTELTRTHRHREPFEVRRGTEVLQLGHVIHVPALVHQLLSSMPASSGTESGSGAVSKPAARIEAIDTVMLIDHEAGEWIDRLGGVIPADRIDRVTAQPRSGSGTVLALARLHGLLNRTDRCQRLNGQRDHDTGAWCCPRHHLEHDVSRWWRQARILTGWDSAAYRPFNTCPVCDHRGGLRINLALQSGFCVECRALWAPTEIGLLADHIRAENEADDSADTPRNASA